MARPYSQDLRDRVIDAVVQGGMSRRGAAARFGISELVAIKWVERFERTGLRSTGKMGGHKRLKLEPHREFLKPVTPRNPTSPFRRCATGCWESAASRPTLR